MVDRRERNRLIGIYETGINQLGLQCLHTTIPVRSNFSKDLSPAGGPVCRSTLFPPDRLFVRECGFEALMNEILTLLIPGGHGKESGE